MAVYQVAVIFEAEHDSLATVVAEHISASLTTFKNDSIVENPKIAFTKFEKEAESQ